MMQDSRFRGAGAWRIARSGRAYRSSRPERRAYASPGASAVLPASRLIFLHFQGSRRPAGQQV